MDEIKANVRNQIMAIPKEDSADCFEKWNGCRDNLNIFQADYFEEKIYLGRHFPIVHGQCIDTFRTYLT